MAEKSKNQIKSTPEFIDTISTLADKIINQAKKMGATAVEVDAGKSIGFTVTVRKNQVETIEHSNGKNLGITVYFDRRIGTATTSNLDQENIDATIAKACHIARFTSPDPFAGLADPKLMAYGYPELDLNHPWKIKVEDAITLAKQAETHGFSYDKRLINSDGASLNTYQSFDIYANSHGFCGSTISTKHSFSCGYIAKHQTEMQRDSHYTIARDFRKLEDANQVAHEAAKRTINRLAAQRITTRKCPIIFTAEIANSLIGNFLAAIHGNNIYRKSTFLLDSLGKQIFAKHINIEENPLIPQALGSAAFDAEGVKLLRNDVVIDGVLQHYILDSYAARKLKMKTTGNAGGVHNLIVKTSNLDLHGLCHKMHTGLLVTELMGDGINIVNGDYSRGVFGYWVKNGVIQHPVIGATIAGNLKDMFLNIIAVGNDIDHRSTILTGSILLDEMIVAGN